MPTKPPISLILLASCLLLGVCALATGPVPKEAKQADGKIDKDKCLACHGPYDKLIEKAGQFKTPGGETVAPHQYVPHEEKKDIPECTECHTPHTMPLEDKSTVDMPKDVKWCYATCHHQNNFQSCSGCH
jgi:hypothetical protein